QEIDPANTKQLGCCKQFGLASLAECLQSWIIALVAEPTTFAPCCCDQVRLDSFGGVLREYAPVAERLIIGVSQDTHQFQFVRHFFSPFVGGAHMSIRLCNCHSTDFYCHQQYTRKRPVCHRGKVRRLCQSSTEIFTRADEELRSRGMQQHGSCLPQELLP